MAEVQVLSFYVRGRNIGQWNRAIDSPFFYTGNSMSLISLFNNLTVKEIWMSHQFGSSGTSPLTCAREGLNHIMSSLKGIAISIQSIANPYRPTIARKPILCVSNQWIGQIRFFRSNLPLDEESGRCGKAYPNPDLSFQSIALCRRAFFLTNVHKASSSTCETFNSLRSMSLRDELCAAACLSHARTVSNLTSSTSATPRKGIPFTKSFKAKRTFSLGVRRS